MANQAGTVVGAISVGIGDAAATLNDDRLQFEFARVPVSVVAYDPGTDHIIFKGTIDENISGKIYEIGIWTAEDNPAAGNQASRIITSFDSESEEWDNETMETTIARIGPDALKHTPALSTTASSVMSGLTLDFIDNSSLDEFVLAYNVDNNNTASIEIRFRTDADNYYKFTITNPTTGYKFATFPKGTAGVVGTPRWDDIGDIEVRTTSKSSGSSSVVYDGIRIEDVDTIAPTYGLIARYVPTLPTIKQEGKVQDIEFSLVVDA